MSSQSRDEIDEQLLLRGRAPLPEEKYPRSFEKRVQSGGYYVAMGLVLSVWMITPLSWYVSSLLSTWLIRNLSAYLVYFTLLGHTINARTSLTGTIFAAYALTEVSHPLLRRSSIETRAS